LLDVGIGLYTRNRLPLESFQRFPDGQTLIWIEWKGPGRIGGKEGDEKGRDVMERKRGK